MQKRGLLYYFKEKVFFFACQLNFFVFCIIIN